MSREHGSRSLVAFFSLSFLIGWGALALLLVFADQLEPHFGPPSGGHPIFVLAVYSPAIAALVLVARRGGLAALGGYLRRLTLWRMPAAWWLFLLLGIPALKYLSAAFNGTAGEFPFSPWYGVLAALLPVLLLGPVEEIGWRGYALPLLQRRFTPLVASLILGALWGLWHLPAFLLGGTVQSQWSFGAFLIGALALSVLMTPMFNAARGSILIPALFHFQLNGPAWPDGQPWENYVFAAAAVVMVLWKRDAFLSRDGAVTDLMAPAR
ncbi:CPBP family intramembrane metalloprotease [Myceligenerans sp. TRM 65318]|uniref:CPBP family intramembrane metalloprotease n=2 Tax=Myceligenerans pegani TaxID=2776917 RepID=A0ABR9N3N0_9MICO|nr:CPBP family intramembrane metalloprotease [Myceligenerans sp. TRM 65318]MBE3020537.1 CPBP family intramembrane metalloprotease [Myceligenerans sp. TRM 65318]